MAGAAIAEQEPAQDQVDTDLPSETDPEGLSAETESNGEETGQEEEQILRSEAERLAQEKLDQYKAEQEKVARDDEGRKAFDTIVKQGITARDGATIQAISNVIVWAANEAREGREPEKGRSLQVLNAIRESLSSWVTVDELRAIDAVLNDRLEKDYPDFKAPKDVLDRAQRAWSRDPETGQLFLAHPRDAWEARLQLIAQAANEAGYARGLAEAEKDQRDKSKVAEQRKAEGQRQTGPTRASGAAGGFQELTVANLKKMTTEQVAKLLEDPKSEQRVRKLFPS